MAINLEKADQSEKYFSSLEVEFLLSIGELGQQTQWTRFLALPVGLTLVAIEAIKVIARISESIFKGLVNVLGSFVYANFNCLRFEWTTFCSSHRGFIMLFGDPAAAIAEGVVNSVASLTIHVLATLLFPKTPCIIRRSYSIPEGFICN